MTTQPNFIKSIIFHGFVLVLGPVSLVLRLLSFALVFVAANIDSVDLQIRVGTFGYWLHLVLLISLGLFVIDELLMVWFFPVEKTTENRKYFYPEGLQSLVGLPAIFIFGYSLFVLWRRIVEGYLFAGHFYVPVLLLVFSAGFLLAWVTGRFFIWKRVEISAADFGALWHRPSWRMKQQQSRENAHGSALEKDPLDVATPRYSYAKVHGYSELKSRLLECGRPVVVKRGKHNEPRNGILLAGDPGNGKTLIAEALAGELKVKFLVMDYSKVISQWVGETPKNIAAAFAQARKAGPCVLFIDEIDSFIINRDGASSQTAESANIVNVLLTELVNIRRYPVLVVAATNRLSKLDPAAIREGRFDFKIEVGNPDEEARTGLLVSSLRKHVKGVPLDESAVLSAAKRWNGFSVKRIMAVGEEMPAYLREHPSAVVGYEQLTGSLRRIQGRKGKLPADTKPLEALVLPEQTRSAVELVASRIADPMRIERLGGTLPSGVLFYGPPGTGKTAVARALAKKTGWAFLSVAGPDLLRDIDQIEKLYSEATELRPVLVFIDEADDILRERGMSNATAVTNKLLTIMDGADGRVKDVVFIATTNNPDLIDPALLRAGRFTEKVPFFAADEQSAAILVSQWLTARQITRMGAGVSVSVVARMLQGQSPANIEGVLQYSLNLAISEAQGDDVVITLDHIGRAYEVVVAQ